MALSGVIALLAGSSRTRAHGDFALSPTASSLYSPSGWRFRTPSSMLDFFVVLICPPFFGLPIYGLFSAVYFGYIAIGRYVLSTVAAVVRSFDVTTACNSTFKQPSTLSAVLLAFVHFVERSSTKGHRPKERFFVLVLLGECELPGSCVHLPVWLMSQEFPEAESPAGFAACQVYGTSTQRAPSQEPVKQLSKTTIVVESTAGTLERSIFAGIPSVATGGLSAAGFIAESLTDVTSCMPARGPNTPAESRDRISSSATRRKQNPLEHPAGSSEGCSLKTTRLEVDSPAALALF